MAASILSNSDESVIAGKNRTLKGDHSKLKVVE
jgi:hypothetical protein